MNVIWWAVSMIAVMLAALTGWHLGRVAGMREMLKGPKPALKPNLDWSPK